MARGTSDMPRKCLGGASCAGMLGGDRPAIPAETADVGRSVARGGPRRGPPFETKALAPILAAQP